MSRRDPFADFNRAAAASRKANKGAENAQAALDFYFQEFEGEVLKGLSSGELDASVLAGTIDFESLNKLVSIHYAAKPSIADQANEFIRDVQRFQENYVDWQHSLDGNPHATPLQAGAGGGGYDTRIFEAMAEGVRNREARAHGMFGEAKTAVSTKAELKEEFRSILEGMHGKKYKAEAREPLAAFVRKCKGLAHADRSYMQTFKDSVQVLKALDARYEDSRYLHRVKSVKSLHKDVNKLVDGFGKGDMPDVSKGRQSKLVAVDYKKEFGGKQPSSSARPKPPASVDSESSVDYKPPSPR